VASVRIRCLNPLAELRARGYPVEQFDRHRAERYAAVVYSKVYDDASYEEALWLKSLGIRLAFDLCDNHFFDVRGDGAAEPRRRRLVKMMEVADQLVTSTDALANVMRTEVGDGRPLTVIGDGVETTIVAPRASAWRRGLRFLALRRMLTALARERATGRTPLVWFGSHGSPTATSGMGDLRTIRPVLEAVDTRHPTSLTVISHSWRAYRRTLRGWRIPTRYLSWQPETFLEALSAHAIAVIPIRLDPFAMCKTNNRLATALQAGVAVVADAIPSYEPFRNASYLNDWTAGLDTYLSNPAPRARHVAEGRRIIARDWTAAHVADQWRDFFDVLRRRP
jgi:glycosyltransferase involved in cell wall biosynthesis